MDGGSKRRECAREKETKTVGLEREILFLFLDGV